MYVRLKNMTNFIFNRRFIVQSDSSKLQVLGKENERFH